MKIEQKVPFYCKTFIEKKESFLKFTIYPNSNELFIGSMTITLYRNDNKYFIDIEIIDILSNIIAWLKNNYVAETFSGISQLELDMEIADSLSNLMFSKRLKDNHNLEETLRHVKISYQISKKDFENNITLLIDEDGCSNIKCMTVTLIGDNVDNYLYNRELIYLPNFDRKVEISIKESDLDNTIDASYTIKNGDSIYFYFTYRKYSDDEPAKGYFLINRDKIRSKEFYIENNIDVQNILHLKTYKYQGVCKPIIDKFEMEIVGKFVEYGTSYLQFNINPLKTDIDEVKKAFDNEVVVGNNTGLSIYADCY